MIDVFIIGINGRFGSTVAAKCTLAGLRPFSDPTLVSTQSRLVAFEAASPDATRRSLDFGLSRKCPVILATSGRLDEHDAMIESAAQQIPVMIATNLSLGAHMLFRFSRIMARHNVDIKSAKIVDRHPPFKKDPISGTALRIDKILRAQGIASTIEAKRLGPPIAEHSVEFQLQGETISLRSDVLDLQASSVGALRAITWALTLKRPGRYSTENMYEDTGESRWMTE